jgi:hypothetical protein
MSILLAVEEDTPCTSILRDGKGYTLHVRTFGSSKGHTLHIHAAGFRRREVWAKISANAFLIIFLV